MSFSKQVKEELNSIQIKNNCCKKAYLFGALISGEYYDNMISVKVTDFATAEKIIFLLGSIYKCSPETKKTKRGCYECTELHFESKKISSFLQLSDSYSETTDLSSIFTCENCKSSFIRGAFCSCGSVSDPHKTYTLELRLPNKNRANLISALIEEWGILPPGQTKRNDQIGLFYRNESMIEDLITACGGNKTQFIFYDIFVNKDVRNNENRATNCDTRNISRVVKATSRQISAIESLISTNLFSEMPVELQITAKLRMENPAISLSELAELHNPPISKSGISHRLSKIVNEAEKRKLI